MKTQTIRFINNTPCERDLGRGFQPYQLNSGEYNVSNLVVVGDIISFDLYEGKVWRGMYIVRNLIWNTNETTKEFRSQYEKK